MHNTRQFTPAHTKTRRMRVFIIGVLLLVIFAVPLFRNGVRKSVGYVGTGIGSGTHAVGGIFAWLGTSVRFKEALVSENTSLKAQVADLKSRLAERDQLAEENANLKQVLGRSGTMNLTLAAVLEKPPHSVYDTLVIDGGSGVGFVIGETVYAGGETPIGVISEVMPNSAIVRLYSAPGEKTDARLTPGNIDVTLVGRGGGNFETTIPHDFSVADATTVVTKEINPSILGVFKKITSDPRDPFQTLLLASPININELAFVQIKTN